VLVQSLDTGLVFNQAFHPELLEYDHDYQNEQGLSAAFQRHLDSMAAIVQRHFAGMSLIEVGCGKGTFLERLQSLASISPGWIRLRGLESARRQTVLHAGKRGFVPTR